MPRKLLQKKRIKIQKPISEEFIKAKAYEIWKTRQQNGRDGNSETDWDEAIEWLRKGGWLVFWWKLRRRFNSFYQINLLYLFPSSNISNWLEKNKIFFETIVALLLSIMAIVVSLKANQITSQQTQLMKAEQLPVLEFNIDILFDSKKKFYTQELLKISNVGGPVLKFNYKTFIFLKVEFYRKEQQREVLNTVLIPINYYAINYVTNNSKGDLATIIGASEGNLKLYQLEKDFSNFARKNKAIGFISIERYIQVSYRDIINEIHHDVYYVSQFNVRKLSNFEKQEIIDKYEDELRKSRILSFWEITPELLYKQWSIRVQESKSPT